MGGKPRRALPARQAEPSFDDAIAAAALLDTATALVVVLDREGRLLRFNRACELATGYGADEVHGERIWDRLVVPEQRERAIRVFGAAEANTIPTEFRSQWLTSDERRRLVHWNSSVATDSDGRVRSVTCVGIDITEEAEIHAAVRRQAQIIEQVQNAIVVADTLGFITSWSRGAEQMTGYSASEAIGRHVSILHPEEDRTAILERFIRPLFETGSHEVETRLLHKSGRIYDAYLALSLDRDRAQKPTGMIAIARDISARKRSERALQKLNQELEERVEARTVELRAAQSKLLQQERLATLGRLTASVSHELRNPLGTMRSSVNILEQLVDSGSEPRIVGAIERIARNVTRCDHIIDELLDYSRIDSLSKVPTMLDPYLAHLLQDSAWAELGIERDFHCPGLEIPLDVRRMKTALTHLIKNAADASAIGSRITIASAKHENTVLITLIDEGHGVAPAVLPKIFEPLYSTKNFGLGLGLPVAKKIIEEHGGEISVQTAAGEGTTVVLRLPRS